jgi:hypothetical protein
MLAPAAWLKYQLSKERAFPPRAEILAEILGAIDLGKRRAPGRRIQSHLEYPVTDTAAHGWEEAQVI